MFQVEEVGKNKRIERKIAGDLILTGKCVASNVKKIAKLIARGSAETGDALIPSGVVNASGGCKEELHKDDWFNP